MNHDTRSVSAIVLAGGRSSRFVSSSPTPNDKLQAILSEGKTAVGITVKTLIQCGIEPQKIIIVTSPNNHSFFKKTQPQQQCIIQDQPLGNAHAAAQARDSITDQHPDIILLVQGDDSFTYSPTDYKQLIDSLDKTNSQIAVMTLDPSKSWGKKTNTFWQAAYNQSKIVAQGGIYKGTNEATAKKMKQKGLSTAALVNTFALTKVVFLDCLDETLPPNPEEKNEIIIPDFMIRAQRRQYQITVVPTKKFLGFNDHEQYVTAKQKLGKNE